MITVFPESASRRVGITNQLGRLKSGCAKLMRDVFLLDEPDGEIRLVDPQRELVEDVGDMLRKFNELRDKSYEISVIASDSREDRRGALADADFVMTTFSLGSMDAFLKNESATAILNLPNTGQIGNLPKDVVVETLATVSPDAVTPKPSGDMPGPIGALCRLHADAHELTVQAALKGDRELLVQAMALDPLKRQCGLRSHHEKRHEHSNENSGDTRRVAEDGVAGVERV